jgi:hypothetical protein
MAIHITVYLSPGVCANLWHGKENEVSFSRNYVRVLIFEVVNRGNDPGDFNVTEM